MWTEMELESWTSQKAGMALKAGLAKSITSPTKLNSGSWKHLEAPGSWYPGSWIPRKERPKKLGVWVVAAPRKLEVDACSPQKAGCPSKLPFQAPKAGFNYRYMQWLGKWSLGLFIINDLGGGSANWP